jgi:hypothetical protein
MAIELFALMMMMMKTLLLPVAHFLAGQFQIERHHSACHGPHTLQNSGTVRGSLAMSLHTKIKSPN